MDNTPLIEQLRQEAKIIAITSDLHGDLMVKAADALEHFQWQDMKDNPRDGEWFLALDPTATPSIFECCYENFDGDYGGHWEDKYDEVNEPQKWMPLLALKDGDA